MHPFFHLVPIRPLTFIKYNKEGDLVGLLRTTGSCDCSYTVCLNVNSALGTMACTWPVPVHYGTVVNPLSID